MTLADANLAFSSTWDIDQLISSGSTSVSSGLTTLYTFSNSALPPVYQVMFQPTGSSNWYQPGQNSTSDTTSGSFYFTAYISGTSLIISTSSTGTARYYVWGDTTNH